MSKYGRNVRSREPIDSSEIARIVAERASFTQKDVKEIFHTIGEVLEEEILKGKAIHLFGVLSIYPNRIKDFKGKNPITLEPREIKGAWRVNARVSKLIVQKFRDLQRQRVADGLIEDK
jgi:nucleoid DNA-binding protein